MEIIELRFYLLILGTYYFSSEEWYILLILYKVLTLFQGFDSTVDAFFPTETHQFQLKFYIYNQAGNAPQCQCVLHHF